jgi:hypothetical protein
MRNVGDYYGQALLVKEPITSESETSIYLIDDSEWFISAEARECHQ